MWIERRYKSLGSKEVSCLPNPTTSRGATLTESRIRIVSVPAGQAPLWVRQKWVGLELPLSLRHTPVTTFTRGVLTKPAMDNHAGSHAPEYPGYPKLKRSLDEPTLAIGYGFREHLIDGRAVPPGRRRARY